MDVVGWLHPVSGGCPRPRRCPYHARDSWALGRNAGAIVELTTALARLTRSNGSLAFASIRPHNKNTYQKLQYV
jgi:hypothetical protein